VEDLAVEEIDLEAAENLALEELDLEVARMRGRKGAEA
jgi:hypothetical protein